MRTWTAIGTLLATTAVLLLSVDVPVAAGADPAFRCQAGKLAAARDELVARLACEQRGLGGASTAACVTAAARRRDAAFARREGAGTCSTVVDSAILGDAVEKTVSTLRGVLLPGGPAPSACTARQLAAARDAIGRLVRAHLRDVRTPDPVGLAAAIAAVRTELAARFGRAAARGDCLSARSAADVSGILESDALTLRGMLIGTCPCWTSASIDLAFPPGFFDASGRGGAVCAVPAPSLVAADSCVLHGPVGQDFTFPRGGVAVLGGNLCVAMADLDPSNIGSCSGVPQIVWISREEAAACTARLLASNVYRQLCD